MDAVKREELEYLFVDVEWNQAPGTKDLEGREPVQIAAIATNSYLSIQSSINPVFSRHIAC
ncbi:hypothetical protein [Blautia sp.]|uniref:hypothetical protein n=1 Tax=Blautia sp. TaxID=1955243 RepID=UPI003AB1F37F